MQWLWTCDVAIEGGRSDAATGEQLEWAVTAGPTLQTAGPCRHPPATHGNYLLLGLLVVISGDGGCLTTDDILPWLCSDDVFKHRIQKFQIVIRRNSTLVCAVFKPWHAEVEMSTRGQSQSVDILALAEHCGLGGHLCVITCVWSVQVTGHMACAPYAPRR